MEAGSRSIKSLPEMSEDVHSDHYRPLSSPTRMVLFAGHWKQASWSFQEHPIKRWEIACEKGRDAYEAGDREDIEYPHMFTVVPSQASCYECLEQLANTDQEELDRLMDYFKSKE